MAGQILYYRLTSTNTRISVPDLGQGWQFEESSDQPRGQSLVTQIRCRLAIPGEFALLTAQDTLLPADEVRTAEAWVREVFFGWLCQEVRGG